MPSNDSEEFDDEEFDDEEDNRFIWQIDAENAVDHALEEAEFDDVRGVIAIPGDNIGHYGWMECRNIEELSFRLEELYDMAWCNFARIMAVIFALYLAHCEHCERLSGAENIAEKVSFSAMLDRSVNHITRV